MKAWKLCGFLFLLTILWLVSGGCGGGSASTTQITEAPTPTPGPSPAPSPTPSPTPTPTPVPSHSVSISWQASSSANVISYNVYRSLTSGGPYSKVGSVAGTSFTDGGVNAGTTYFYVISAVNNSGVESPASSPEQSVTVPQ